MKVFNNSLSKGTAVVLLTGVLLASCTKDFDAINTNPNATTEENVQPGFLLTGQFNAAILDPGMHERITQLTNDVFSQYYANEGFSTQNGLTNDEWIASFWKDYHYHSLISLNKAISIGKNSGQAYNETQIARIWRVWLCARATDIFGDMPYSKAADGTNEVPPYDKQEDIYTDFFKELSEAVPLLTTANKPQGAGQDYVYNDDISKWQKFGNSLRLRLAMRISKVNPALAQQQAEAAVAAGVFTSDDQSCLVPRGEGFGWGYDYQYTYYYGWGAESMSRSMENLLTGLGGQAFPNPPPGFAAAIDADSLIFDDPGITLSDLEENTIDPNANKFRLGVPSTVDPRGPIYYNVTSFASGATKDVIVEGEHLDTRYRWHGVPAGLTPVSGGKNQYSVYNTTRLGTNFNSALSRSYEVMTYHEVCFLLAEAAQLGWNVGGSAQTWYETGIKASMDWHGVDPATRDAYVLSSAQNTYGTTVKWTNDSGKQFLGRTVDDPMSKIITQKYIALFPDGGWEAWADHRRTHLPVLIPFTTGLDSRYTVHDGGPDNFTKRVTYPAVEELNDKVNYDAAVARQGADLETTHVWWDVD